VAPPVRRHASRVGAGPGLEAGARSPVWVGERPSLPG